MIDETNYDSAMARLEALMEVEEDHAQIAYLAGQIAMYEKTKYPIRLPTAVDAIRFRMDQQDLRQADLVPFIGSRSHVSEVLSGKRSLSLRMIRRLHAGLGIPLACLVGVESD